MGRARRRGGCTCAGADPFALASIDKVERMLGQEGIRGWVKAGKPVETGG